MKDLPLGGSTTCRRESLKPPISLLSVIADTLEKSLLPYITTNIPNTPTQHGYKTQHSTVTALHTLNNTIAKGFNQMAPPARTITVALDMSKAFDIINIHTLIRKLLQPTFQAQCCCCMPFSTILVVNPGSPGLESSVLVSS